ncbi:hypothetical protein PCANB_001625 [Pneumocystis canis]|nr:hypothetical protein PCK1_001652 [Pneumocystis canis]KAG5436872.1 hypothetical protein PCANB_001625 [Pneumocystis canis]
MNTAKISWQHNRNVKDFKDSWCKTNHPAWLNTESAPTIRSIHPNEQSDIFRPFGTLQQAQYHQAATAQAAAMAHTMKLVANEDKAYSATNQPPGIKTQAVYERGWTFSASDQDYTQRTPLITNTTVVHETKTSVPTLQESNLGVDVFRKKRAERARDVALNGLSQLHVNIHGHDNVQHKPAYPYQMSNYSSNYDCQASVLHNHYLSTQNIKHDVLDSGKYNRGCLQSQKENTIHSFTDPYVNYTSASKHFFKEPLNQNGSFEYHEVVKKPIYPYYSIQNNNLPKNTTNVQPIISAKHIFQNTISSATHYDSKISQKKYRQGKQTQPFEYIEDIFYHPQHCYKNTLFVPQQTYTGPMTFAQNFPNQARRQNEKYQTLRSSLLEEFRNNKTKKYELKDIFGHIVEFSGDQHGSRFIQQTLEVASIEDKEAVFQEILPSSLQLMTDVFGNYVIQKFIEYGTQAQKTLLLEQMKGNILNLSLQTYGCRVVQKALEYIQMDQRIDLVKELDGNVLKCIKNQNGNHVIQKIIEKVPIEHIQFLIDTFQGKIYVLATHPYGCRVVQRMLEYCSQACDLLLNELHLYSQNLIQDQYGNYCIQHIIEKGEPEDRSKIISVVKGNIFQFSKHKFASNVVEKCITYGTDEEKKLLINEIMKNNEDGSSFLLPMIKNQYANYVIKKALDVANDDQRNKLISEIKPHLQFLKKNVHGKALSSNIERLITLSNNQSGQSDETATAGI